MSYKHLSLEERHYVEVSLQNGKALSRIDEKIGRQQCTISREIARNIRVAWLSS